MADELFPRGPIQKPTLRQMINAAVREKAMRQSVYPGLVKAGTIKQETADFEIACMDGIAQELQKLYMATDNPKGTKPR